MQAKTDFFTITTRLAVAAVFAALVYVATSALVIPIPATKGYFNLGETVIYTAALLFGSLVGAFSGGLGAAIADTLAGYTYFAPGTFIIKAFEGTVVGFLNTKLSQHTKANVAAILSTIIGGVEMVTGYFLYEWLVLGYTVPIAAAEIPFNVVQMTVGLVIAVPITQIVLRIFPQLRR
jgi:uncharacterized membrane protein